MTTNEDDMLAALATRLFGDADIEAATPIASGWTNRVLQLRHRRGSAVVRLARDPETEDVAARRREAQVWALAAAAGVAPEPLLIEAETGLLVTPVVAPRDLRAHLDDAPPTPALLDALGALVARFHAIDASALPAFDPVARIDADLARARRSGPGLDPAVIEVRARLPSLECSALVHHDLIPDNVLVGDRLWLVDLEVAGPGDPDLDLVTLARSLGLDAAARARLFRAAGRGVPDDERLAGLGALFELGEHAWAAARLAEGRSEAGVRTQFADSLEALRRAAGEGRRLSP